VKYFPHCPGMEKNPSGERHCASPLEGGVPAEVVSVPAVVGIVVGPELPGSFKNIKSLKKKQSFSLLTFEID